MECLGYILDNLHEDVNQVTKKPKFEMGFYDGSDDKNECDKY